MTVPVAGTVGVPVATLFPSPDTVRRVDLPVLAAQPDVPGWVAGMTPAQQVDKQGVLTQLLYGEPVLVEESRADGWSRVIALAQPAGRLDPRGYPGWLRSEHLGAAVAEPSTVDGDPLEEARKFIGTPYVWGGLTEHGIDCSGLVHLVFRRLGVVVPRDASDQFRFCAPVPEGRERPGDLYFFANPGRPAHHVGFVTPNRFEMVNASYDDHVVLEQPFDQDRVDTFAGVRRVTSSASR